MEVKTSSPRQGKLEKEVSEDDERLFAQIHVQELTALLPASVRASLYLSQGRFWLHEPHLAEPILAPIMEHINRLSVHDSLLLDFRHATLSNDLLQELLTSLFYPKTYDGRLTDRYTQGKKVIIVNPDAGTLLGIAQSLELAHAQCMVVPNTQSEPWDVMYVGFFEGHLKDLLERIHADGNISTTRLAIETGGNAPNAIEHSKALNRFTGPLKELFDYGLVNREKLRVDGRSQPSYRYSYYHPYKHIDPTYSPTSLNFYRAPRPPRTQQAAKTHKKAKDEPEPERSQLLEHSYAQLTERERYIIRLLSVLRGEWNVTEAAAICSDTTAETLQRFCALGLIIKTSLEDRFKFATGMQQFAQEKLAQDEHEQTFAHTQHTRLFFERYQRQNEDGSPK